MNGPTTPTKGQRPSGKRKTQDPTNYMLFLGNEF